MATTKPTVELNTRYLTVDGVKHKLPVIFYNRLSKASFLMLSYSKAAGGFSVRPRGRGTDEVLTEAETIALIEKKWGGEESLHYANIATKLKEQEEAERKARIDRLNAIKRALAHGAGLACDDIEFIFETAINQAAEAAYRRGHRAGYEEGYDDGADKGYNDAWSDSSERY